MSALVWAKMKGFPAWPARIIDPKAKDFNPKIRKEAQKSPPNSHFVKFYGTHDFSWVLVSVDALAYQNSGTHARTNLFWTLYELLNQMKIAYMLAVMIVYH